MKRLLAIFGMVALLSPPLLVSAGQEIIPNGVARIGAAGESLDYSAIGVAIIDTGIDPSIPDLNVVGGVDCSNATGGYIAERSQVPGGQRSIWDARPPAKVDEAGKPIADPARDAIVSLSGKRFGIQTVGKNPSEIGGANLDAEGYEDGNGHGTHVAGIIGAAQDGQGLVGVAPNARLYAVRVLDSGGGGSLDNVVCGLDWVAANAADENISVVNMSLGLDTGQRVMELIEPCDSNEDDLANYIVKSGKMSDEFHEAICDVVDAGVVVVVAAGNGWGDSATTIPAAYPEVITVSNFADFDGLSGGLADSSATACPAMGGNDDQLWSHLNGSPQLGYGSYGGEAVDLAAPGVCVLSTFPGGMAALTGTSMASPHVAGTVARLINDTELALTRDTLVRVGSGDYWVSRVTTALLDGAEAQDAIFRDSDDWHEGIARVGGE
jgi:subtilisin family serine protease